jgi:hypothetical protein
MKPVGNRPPGWILEDFSNLFEVHEKIDKGGTF